MYIMHIYTSGNADIVYAFSALCDGYYDAFAASFLLYKESNTAPPYSRRACRFGFLHYMKIDRAAPAILF